MIAIAVLLLAAATAPRTIAVSYFDNTSKDASLDPLRKGLADMMITDLATAPTLKVVERERLESIVREIKLERGAFFDRKTAQRLGHGLGAELVLTGSFLVLGDHVRLDVRVVRVRTGEIVATDSADGKKDEFFDVEKELVEELLHTLDVKLDRSQRRALEHRQTSSFDALAAYSRGLDARDRGDDAAADEAFRAALRADPAFQAAKSALGRVKAIVQRESAEASAEAKELAAHERDPDFGKWLNDLFIRIGYDFDTAKYRERIAILRELVAKNLKPALTFGSLRTFVEPAPLYALLATYETEPELMEKLPAVVSYLYLKYPGDPSLSAYSMRVRYQEQAIDKLHQAQAKVEAAAKLIAAGRPFVIDESNARDTGCAALRDEAIDAGASVRLLAETTHEPAALDGYAERFLASYDARAPAVCVKKYEQRLVPIGRDAFVIAVATTEGQLGDRAGFEKWFARLKDQKDNASLERSMKQVIDYRAPVFETRKEAAELLDLVAARSR